MVLFLGTVSLCGASSFQAPQRGYFRLEGPARSDGLEKRPNGWKLKSGVRSGGTRIRPQGLPTQAQSVRLSSPSSDFRNWSLRVRRDRSNTWLPVTGNEWTRLSGAGPLQFELKCSSDCLPRIYEPAIDVTWAAKSAAASGTKSAYEVPTGYVKAEITDLLKRKEWGANPPFEDYNSHVPEAIVVHHSWLPTVWHYQSTGGAESVAGIQKFHMYDPARRWNDVGYHFLIGSDGLIFEGRPATVVGAHAVPNTGKVGICMIGNHDPEGDPVTAEAWNALTDLVTALAFQYDIPMEELYGHRNFSHKTCPGDRIYNRFGELRKEVHRRIGTMGLE